ncbi:MAG: branched-chain-amino-acid transaminase [Firmicutes bacterium]|nr:branched-chain-amino-acid transaminase [Bacillota bacterium]
MKVFVNGKIVPKKEATISVFDHGFLYGDGVFEGIRAYNGRVFKLKEHIRRLYESAQHILLTIPYKPEEMEQAVLKTVRENNLRDAYIRLVVSRGAGDLGLDPQNCREAQVIIIADKIALFSEEMYRRGLKVVTVPTRRNICDALDPQIKSLNYLNNILVKIEANQAGVMEALMLDHNGFVTEGSGDNVFIFRRGKLRTPPAYLGILEGITREVVLEAAREDKIPVQEVPFTRHDVYVAAECFLTGTAAEIIPVVEVDGRKIGDGLPGPVTARLMKRFREITMTEGVDIY